MILTAFVGYNITRLVELGKIPTIIFHKIYLFIFFQFAIAEGSFMPAV
jgi:hypothetical protein